MIWKKFTSSRTWSCTCTCKCSCPLSMYCIVLLLLGLTTLILLFKNVCRVEEYRSWQIACMQIYSRELAVLNIQIQILSLNPNTLKGQTAKTRNYDLIFLGSNLDKRFLEYILIICLWFSFQIYQLVFYD